MNKERLLKLANLLDTVPVERLNMTHWGDNDFSQENCQTCACAAGWATTIFEQEGLTLRPSSKHATIIYDNDYGYWALVKFFDIADNHTEYLFYKGNYTKFPITPSDVAERIRSFVNAPR